MTDNLERLDLTYIETVDDPIAKHLVSSCIRNNFQLSEEFGTFAENLVILDGSPITLASPKILFGGRNTLASTEFEINWPKEVVTPSTLFSSNYRELAAHGYRDCMTSKEVVVEHIECENSTLAGQLPVNYKRVLIPQTNGLGAWFIACYAFGSSRARYPMASELSVRFQSARILENTNLHTPY